MKKTKKEKQTKIEEVKSQLIRALADYDNLKKRIERETPRLGNLANARLVKNLLPAFDMLETAEKHTKDSGLAIAIEELKKGLEKEDIVQIKPKKGDKFDENMHEAVEAVKVKNQKKGDIIKTVLTGWKVGENIIRPAKVVVSK